MSFLAKRELLARVVPRYQSATSQQKSVILDEFVAVTGYARKYAIRLLARICSGLEGIVRRETSMPRNDTHR